MCWFYMGIVQTALDPPMARANVEKKVPQTIPASPYTPGQPGKKVPQTILASLTPAPYGQCPYGNNTFQKGASLKVFFKCQNSTLGPDHSEDPSVSYK